MEPQILNDKTQFPTEEIIFSHIGKSQALWCSLFEYIHSTHPNFIGEWRYYNDGKSWLYKLQNKKKTVFWLSIIKGSFRTTFYFPIRVEQQILESPIPDELKEQFAGGKKFNKVRFITITYKKKKDVENAKALIGLKLSIK